MKYYAVKRGRTAGVYESWAECIEQIDGYSGAVFKSFEDRAEAERFLSQAPQTTPINKELPFTYIDGTYSQKAGMYGYGGFICYDGKTLILQGTGNNPEYIDGRNIAGELMGTLQAAYTAIKLHIKEINMFFDYVGVEQWATGAWEAKTPLTRHYRDMMDLIESDIKIHFFHVLGHTHIWGNEIADFLAKEAIGARLNRRDAKELADFKANAHISTNA